MARSMRKTTLREIRHTFGRYMAILAIIALGVGFFSGVRDTTPAMVNMMNGFLEENNFYDFRIISTSGWNDESVEEFAKQPEVLMAEGSISFDASYSVPDDSIDETILITHMLPEKINTIKLVEGTFPEKPGECAVEQRKGYKIGDKIILNDSNDSKVLEMVKSKEFTVTALVISPYYLNREKGTTKIGDGSVDSFLYLSKDSFNTEYYSEVFVRFNTDYVMYSKKYNDFIDDRTEMWEELAEKTALNHHKKLLAEAEAELSDAKEEYENGIKDGQEKLDAAAAELADGRKKLEDTKKQLDVAKADIDMLKSYLGADSPDAIKAETDYNNGVAEYEKGLEEFEKGEKEYQDALAEFEEKSTEGGKKISDAEKEIAELKTPSVYVLNRNTNVGYALFENDSEIVEQVAKVFPIFFILVAALVCMTTMSRMVEEQRTQIGILKAIGYSEASIMGKFMFYSCSAALIGCVLGFAVGTKLFPAIIWVTYKIMYIPLDMPYYFDKNLAVAATVVSMLCSAGTTWIACRVELKETAASLMRPKAPKAGKRVLPEYIPFLWKRLKFLHKVSIRNIFRYKGRFFMMVTGIGGCMALLLIGFGLKDSIAGFANTQYGEIITAHGSVSFLDSKYENVNNLLNEKTDSFVMMHHSSWDLLYDDRVKSIDLKAVEDFSNISEFMVFRDSKKQPISPPQLNEAIICHSISDRYNIEIGDELTLRDADMRELHLTVSGIFENHTYNLVYTSLETCKKQLNEDISPNMAFINFKDGEAHSKQAVEINKNSGVIYVEQFVNTRDRMAEMMSSLDYIVILVIACAAALAFIVIYNLTNINITERQREIATIKVLGFFRRETSAYVLRENIALTFMGILAGIVIGIPLHSFVMSQIKVDIVDFSTIILPQSYMYSAVLTLIFNFVVNLFMEIKLEKINMAESLKSVD